MNNNFNYFSKKEELHTSLAQKVADLLEQAIKEDGKAILAVSGGSTPKPFFKELSKIDLDWEKVKVTLVDERWVENTHDDSNEKLVHENLLQNYAQKASFIPLKNCSSSPFEGQKECNGILENLNKPIDVLILGMGTDGHTASFFPKDENLENALNTKELCAATIPSDAPHQRMTLSLNTILQAKELFLHLEGQKKKEVYNEALKEGLVEHMPIRSILKDKKSLEVYYGE